ncbi:ferrous iron transporter B [Peredibacter starrii]|uniref:Ferrous iron transporter B n=1 Tax=Peredibacter starrii TaxID=28202 RepID=A0AAX4HRJ7_9BACT|nr:ferrous iron transporter B [Peredibacter starrii]WPU65959.1 ferrous iron transporter B [Peredibacter starrii]
MIPRIALVGMPNVGKTALFNKLTGSFQRVANFPGVTVEKKTGWVSEGGEKIIEVIDLPGIYSLDATTLDEKVTKDFLLKKESQSSADLFVLVLDATNLEKSLFLAFQLKQLGYPLIIALNLFDEAKKRQFSINLDEFAKQLNAIVVPTSASTGEGVSDLVKALKTELSKKQKLELNMPEHAQKVFRSPAYVNGIFKSIDGLLKDVTITPLKPDTFSERIDSLVLHPVWGIVILFSLLILVFQTLFTWASPLMDGIEAMFGFVGEMASTYIDNELLKSLIVDGIISGVGGVLVFLPQIVLLFLFIQFLEDLGYLGRAAFLMDSFMRKIGLPGKSVIPLLSSHACAIPGILSTRVIDNYRERLITMLVIPLTTCSARLPVYAILIGALIPNVAVFGLPWLKLPGLVLFGLYMLGFVSALVVSLVFKKTLPHSSPSMLLMELPPYRVPKIKNLLLVMKNKAMIFLKKAGGIILVISIVIWVLVTFPQKDGVSHIEESYAASIGHVFEPVFRPLGFDWRITTALIPSIGAREVVVSALSMVLSIEEGAEGFEKNMSAALVQQFGLGTLVALLIWFVFAPQCISTFAVMKRETDSIKWPLIMVSYTLALAYLFAFLARMLINLWF